MPRPFLGDYLATSKSTSAGECDDAQDLYCNAHPDTVLLLTLVEFYGTILLVNPRKYFQIFIKKFVESLKNYELLSTVLFK